MECERSGSNDPLRQGDIIAAHPQTTAWASPWTRFGVIVSADCDLEQEKAGPSIVYIPIVSHYAYLGNVWAKEEVARLVTKGQDAIEKVLREYDARLTYRHVKTWGKEGGSALISERLAQQRTSQVSKANPTKSENKLEALWDTVKALETLSEASTFVEDGEIREYLKTLMEHKKVVEDKPIDRAVAIENVLNSLQGRVDTWLLRELIGLDPDMQHDSQFGFVACLRYFSVLNKGAIETDRLKWYERQDSYLRICRLRGLYKSDLVQRFANLFVRVGLEDERAEEHKRLFKRFSVNLFPKE